MGEKKKKGDLTLHTIRQNKLHRACFAGNGLLEIKAQSARLMRWHRAWIPMAYMNPLGIEGIHWMDWRGGGVIEEKYYPWGVGGMRSRYSTRDELRTVLFEFLVKS